MHRVRQSSAGLSPAIVSRMSAAVALSVALHVFLIYGISLPADSAPAARITVIHAHLSPQQDPSPRQAKRRELDGVSESVLPKSAMEPPAPEPAAIPVTAVAAPESVADDTLSAATSTDAATKLDIPDPVSYAAKDLDIYPQALKPITPLYPRAAREARVAGFVTLMVSIDESGRVVDTSVTDAVPDGIFEQVAQQALASAAFFPAQKEGRTVRSRILIKVEFDPALADALQ